MNAYTHHHTETNDLGRRANAGEVRQRAQRIIPVPLGDRMHMAVSKRLITWGSQLDVRQR